MLPAGSFVYLKASRFHLPNTAPASVANLCRRRSARWRRKSQHHAHGSWSGEGTQGPEPVLQPAERSAALPSAPPSLGLPKNSPFVTMSQAGGMTLISRWKLPTRELNDHPKARERSVICWASLRGASPKILSSRPTLVMVHQHYQKSHPEIHMLNIAGRAKETHPESPDKNIRHVGCVFNLELKKVTVLRNICALLTVHLRLEGFSEEELPKSGLLFRKYKLIATFNKRVAPVPRRRLIPQYVLGIYAERKHSIFEDPAHHQKI